MDEDYGTDYDIAAQQIDRAENELDVNRLAAIQARLTLKVLAALSRIEHAINAQRATP